MAGSGRVGGDSLAGSIVSVDRRQYVLRVQEKGGKSREIRVRHDLEGFILPYVDAAGITGEAQDAPLFRASNGRSRKLAAKPLGTERICELFKLRIKGCRAAVSAVAAFVPGDGDYFSAGAGGADGGLQYMAGHAEPRTTTLYGRRKKRMRRNIAERIPIEGVCDLEVRRGKPEGMYFYQIGVCPQEHSIGGLACCSSRG